MNFTCGTADLSQAIDIVSRCLPARAAKEAYNYIQIEADGSVISVSATDGAMYMVSNIDNSGVNIMESGIIALDGRLLTAVISKQTERLISLTSNEKNCTIQCGKAKTQLPLRPADDFPDMPPVSPDSKNAKVAQGDLRTCIDYVSFCTSNDQTKKVLTGVLMDFHEQELCVVALDGFRMALRKVACDFEGEACKCVVPKSSAVEIGRLMKDGEPEKISLRVDKDYLHVWAGSCAFSTVLLSGQYIDYTRLIRPDCKTKSLIDARQLRGSVERAQVMASNGKNDLVHLHFADSELKVASESANGLSNDEMDVGLQGEPLDIAFNSRYLVDMLKREPDGELDVEFSGPVSPALFRPLDQKDRLQIVLPVRVLGGRPAT